MKKKIDWEKGSGTFVFGYMIMILALFICLVLIEQHSLYINAVETQIAVDSFSDGLASYASSFHNVSDEELYNNTIARGNELLSLMESETNVKNIVGLYIDKDQFEDDDTVYMELKARYTKTSSANSIGRATEYYDILRSSATKFVRRGITGDAVWPCSGDYISSGFYHRVQPISGATTNHAGIDIPDNLGAPYFAVADGIVTSITRPDGMNGITEVEVYHGTTTDGEDLYTAYFHGDVLSSLFVGQNVTIGQQLGTVNSYGPSTGEHVHLNCYTIDSYGSITYRNPLKYLYHLNYDGTDDGESAVAIALANGSFMNRLTYDSEMESFEWTYRMGDIYYR